MRQEQERFRSVDRGVATNPPRGWNHIDTSGEMGLLQRHSGERSDSRISKHLERFWTIQNDEKHLENNRESREEEVPRRTYVQKTDGFEPFVNPEEPQEENLFVNNYGGNFSQKMELNRRGVEIVLKIAHLEGKVQLTNLSPSRSRSAEAQGEELAAKRLRLFGEKTEKDEEENPYKRVTSVPEGWRIEINDTRITEELTERQKLTGKKLKRAFINRLNGQLKEALRECVWREKLSSEKDRYFRGKLFSSIALAAGPFMSSSVFLSKEPVLALFDFGLMFALYGSINASGHLRMREVKSIEQILKEINPNYKGIGFYPVRNVDHLWEYFMPQVEIDKVARTYAYLEGKGRRLVRETKDR